MMKEVKDGVEIISKAVDSISSTVQAGEELERQLLQMKKDIRSLHIIRKSVDEKVRIYWFPQKEIIRWLHEVEVNDSQADKLAKRKSLVSKLSPDSGLVKDIDAQMKTIDELTKKGKELEDALEKTETKRIEKLAATINIEKISLLKETLKKILKLLKDEQKTKPIQVCGPKGTGKTALIQHLNNDDALSGMFDIVIWCDIGNSTNTKIQLTIAKRLGLKSTGTEDDIRSKIREELKDARYLLLLANITNDDIDLDAIGIPTDTKGNKIVYTTYGPHIRPFPPVVFMPITRLSEKESYVLFKDIWKYGNTNEIEEQQIGIIIRKIARWCNGYFSLIKIVAENFKQKSSLVSWDEGLNMLRTPAMREDKYMQVMVNILHCSYDCLKDNQKLCFLFSILYGEDSKIPTDCLLDCWKTLNLLGPSNTGQSILEHLVKVHLLIKGGSNKQYVTVDRICRQAAMKILQGHETYKCLVGEEALEKLKGDECKDTNWISLTDIKIDDLPNEVDCSNLTTLLLQEYSKQIPVSSSFFKQMKDLLILDLSKTRSESVLLRDMEKLKLLNLNGSVMTEFPVKIEHLYHKLEVLDIRGCITDDIPEDLEKLKCLRRLKMSIKEGGTLDPIIRKLSWLKDFIIDVKLNDEPVDGVSHMSRYYTVIENIIEGIGTLTELTTLRFYFEKDIVDVIQVMHDTLRIFVPKQASLRHFFKDKDVNLREREHLQVYIGIPMSTKLELPEHFYKYGSYVLSSDTIVNGSVIKNVLKEVRTVILVNNSSIVHLDPTTMLDIKRCLVQRCKYIKTLVPTGGFSKLRKLILSDCSQLKALFFKKVVKTAIYIKYLEIRDCLDIEEIDMSLKGGADFLPVLKTLVLHNLESLKKICLESDLKKSTCWHSLETLEIHMCPMLTQIVPLQGDNVNSLLRIKVEEECWKNLQFDPKIKAKFEKRCEFRKPV